ncbi:MAG TPA: PEGA domain-containing protein [Candidatus Sulfotelmatobacter sp.]|nr:PEGA domain-containing protein [Candidatus Sulfotelmatobacter sp.]
MSRARCIPLLIAFIIALLAIPGFCSEASGNQVMGELHLEGKTKVENTSGVWIDGQYVGFLKELKGKKKILLLPGTHTVQVRQNGYQDFTQTVTMHPGQKLNVEVSMEKAATGAIPAAWSIVKIDVFPTRAAVFLDGRFVGHVGEFEGLGRSLEVAPGDHKIKIALPGYKTFETEINPTANQKVEVKTALVKSNGPITDPSLERGGDDNTPPPPPDAKPIPPPPPQR